MRTIHEITNNPALRNIVLAQDGGTAVIHIGRWDGSVIWSTGAGWEHVSVAPFKRSVTPSWDDMCDLKNIFWQLMKIRLRCF